MFTPNPALMDIDRFNVARSLLSAGVECCARAMARRLGIAGWRAVDDGAPDTYDAVVADFAAASATNGWAHVYAGASDATIYTAPEVNHAFRFWHDATHYVERADFTPEGEIRTALAQINYMADVTALDRGDAVRLLYADTIGQVEAFKRTRAFIRNQRAFVQVYAASGDLTAAIDAGCAYAQ